MKQFFLLFACAISINSSQVLAQFNIIESHETDAIIKKDTKCSSYGLNGNSYFVIKNIEGFNEKYNLLTVSADGNNISNIPLVIDGGTLYNMNSISGIDRVGKTAFVAIENRNKPDGKNTFIIRTLSDKGALGAEKKEIGFIPYTKMIDPGTWLYYVTNDKQHIAVVAVYPAVKGEPQLGKFYFLDNTFNVIATADLNIPATEKKKNYAFNLLASDKGDVYLINNEYEKSSYKIPVVYRKLANEKTFTENIVLLKEPYRVFDYTAAITETGSLLLGGYTQEKRGSISFGSTSIKGVWFYNTEKPTETNIIDFDKPASNLKVLGLLNNGNTAFLVGEQIIEKKEPRPVGYMGFDENYFYEYNDIVVTGYNVPNSTKFDIQLPRKMAGRNFLADLAPSFGIVNEKLCILYNDDLKKFVENAYSYKVPVTVLINNDGLMEQPTHYEKQFKTGNSGYNQLCNFSYFKSNQITTLSLSGNYVKSAIFK
jgi:hypothetical protein